MKTQYIDHKLFVILSIAWQAFVLESLVRVKLSVTVKITPDKLPSESLVIVNLLDLMN